MTPDLCPHCGEVRALEPEQGTRRWFCATCGRTFAPTPGDRATGPPARASAAPVQTLPARPIVAHGPR